MSRSSHTQKESRAAERLIERDADGKPRLPRVIERAATPGDTHPIPKRVLRRVLTEIPIEYVYGLSRIEMRARQEPGIGRPFGCYVHSERAIILYSLPPVWHFDRLAEDCRQSLERFHARIVPDLTGFTIWWPETALMSLWFYCYVFTHELGHHFAEQYKAKNSPMHLRSAAERSADLHARRLTDQLFASLGGDPRRL
jgi:hypothetical protein